MDESYGVDEYGTPGGHEVPPGRTTLGALRGAGYRYHSVRTEIRENLVARLSMGRPSVSTVVGFDDTVLPDLERTLFALHHVVALGDRGQGKSTLLRGLRELLDVWTPVIDGSVLHEHPMRPQSAWAHSLIAEHGDETPVDWINRDVRLAELSCTADITAADLIGDHEPQLGHGLLPAMNRGIVVLDDLAALPPRAQAVLARVLSDGEITARGGATLLPLDTLVVAAADRRDYQEYGRVVAPLRDRFAGVITTHYPPTLADEIEILRRSAVLGPRDSNLFIPQVPGYLIEIVARFARAVRATPDFEPEAAASVRYGIGALETLGGSAARRASLHREDAIVRPADLSTLISAGLARIRSAEGDPEHERRLLAGLLDEAIAQTCRTRLTEQETSIIAARFGHGVSLATGPDRSSREVLDQLGTVPQFSQLLQQLGIGDGAETPGLAAGAVEFVLEGLITEGQVTRHREQTTITYRSASEAGP
ncbi:sigma 54-interacting transcriptional regulator [Microlunatus speluncae]|uniref:sigma 54-interacting transcriptional regulator n=1 Tax=Microlunatus speluncae TaxID=2594267 RepID=UPI0012661AE3|nr:sigma 54-interacting transcriptional regulator [Microlunatus speluncae]